MAFLTTPKPLPAPAVAALAGFAAAVVVRVRRIPTRADLRRRLVGERGGVTPFVLLFVIPMAMMAGLAFDGGRVLSERRAALDVAQNAALAGAQAVDGSSLRQGVTTIDTANASTAANNWLAAQGYSGTVTVSGDTITVTVNMVVDMQLLGAIGVGPKTVTGVGRARIVRGVDGAET